MLYYFQAPLLALFFLCYNFCFAEGMEVPTDETYHHQESAVAGTDSDGRFLTCDPLNPVLSAECEPLATVAGCVNVISGQFFQIEDDLVDTTIEPLSFTRFYDSGNGVESLFGFGFGSQYPFWASDVQKGARHHYGLISEREGFYLLYRDKESGPSKICFIDPRLLEKGYTNLSRAAVSGHANFVNWKAQFRKSADAPKGEWTVQLGDGTKRIYGYSQGLDHELKVKLNFPSEKGYLLQKEIKPNGNELHFDYATIRGKPFLNRIRVQNRAGNPIHQISFHHSKDGTLLKNPSGCVLKSPCGEVCYHFEEKPRLYGTRLIQRKFLTKTESSQKGSLQYQMTDLTWRMKKILKPEGQSMQISYYPSGKVKELYETLSSEVGEKRYQFNYYEDQTHVFDAHGRLTAYHFDDHKRLSSITYVEGIKPVRQEFFEWSLKNGEEGWLKSKTIGLGNELQYLKDYQYDQKGNITKETLWGNLTGEKTPSFSRAEVQQMDRYSLFFFYTNDDKNLLKESSTPEGLHLCYDYLPGTNLCTSKLCKYEGKIQERTFSAYDDNGQLQTLIEDDGSQENSLNLQDVTYRKIKRITAISQPGASFGKPAIIAESYLDETGNEVLLKRIELAYDSKGLEIERKVFDSQGTLCFTSEKEYDDRLLLIRESDPLGQTTRYQYDDNRNKIEEEIESVKTVRYTYDYHNRLIEKNEIHKDNTFTTTYCYNNLDQLESETDPYGQTTTYRYDRLGNQIACIKPPIEDQERNICYPATTKKYNLLNQAIEATDENGNATTISYNIYGSPTKITYPDGSQEHLTYTPHNKLKRKVHADGTSISYSYDAKGHLLKEIFHDQNGTHVKSEEYAYKGPFLQSKTDSMGLVTSYAYDRAGRKVKETIGGIKTIHYTYDDFDRLIKKQQGSRIECTTYDWLDRPLSKTLLDTDRMLAQETYTYDRQGNRITQTILQSQSQPVVYKAQFNADGSLKSQTDPLGNSTTWQYNHQFTNALGLQVKAATIRDPLGRPSQELEDSHHRLSSRLIYDGEKLVSSTEFSYDPAGNCTKELSKVMPLDGTERLLRQYAIHRTYNNRGLLASETEWPDGKTTTYVYDSMGRPLKKIKPDKIKLSYTYDPLGNIKTLSSSDGTVHNSYLHDTHGNLIQAHDHVHESTLTRQFDLCGRLEWEEFSPNVRITYQYDPFDRPTKATLPDGSYIHYIYNACRLSKIERFDPAQKLLYAISCEYDLQGNLVQCQSPAGKIQSTHDLLGRAVSIQSPHWMSTLDQFDAAGNLLQMTLKDPHGIFQAGFAYDRLNQLKFESAYGNRFSYDSLGNCLSKNDQTQSINELNQLIATSDGFHTYDINGNLTTENSQSIRYTYDALNRLICREDQKGKTTFRYDALGRCMEIQNASGIKQLLYQGMQEIGSIQNGALQEFRLIHPEKEYTFAIELAGETFFPIQDAHHNICALQNPDGSLAQYVRFSAFGDKKLAGDSAIFNPWSYSNRREIVNLILFTHRFYNPSLMRWITTDPIGFEDGLNLYRFVRNNPYTYRDPDGRFAFAVPIVFTLLEVGFGTAVSATILPAVVPALLIAGACYAGYKLGECINKNDQNTGFEEEQSTEQDEKRKKPPYCGQELGNDPTKCPGEGFEWRGRGDPGTGRGSWVKDHRKPNQVSLHPDLEHPPPKAPHWDYEGPDYPKGAELYLNGTWKPKDI